MVLVNASIKGNVHADTVKLSTSGHDDGRVECPQLDQPAVACWHRKIDFQVAARSMMTMLVVAPTTNKLKTMAQVCVKVLGVGLLVAFGSHAWTEPIEAPSQALEFEQVQKKIRHISGQLLQLRQMTLKTGKDQQDLSKAIQQEVEMLALHQTQLKQELAELEVSGQQQIEQLQRSHQRLRWAFGVTVALLGLALGWLALIWRTRKTQQPAQAVLQPTANQNRVDTHTHMTMATVIATGTSTETESIIPADAARREVLMDAEIPDVAVMPTSPVQAPHSIASEQARETAPWAALVAADLQNTQMAMAQARQDFMRPPRIQP